MDDILGKRATVGTQAVEVFSIKIRSGILRPHSSDERYGIFGTIHVEDEISKDGVEDAIYEDEISGDGIEDETYGDEIVEDGMSEDDTLYLYNRGSTDIDYFHSTSGTCLSLLTLSRPIAPTKLLRIVFNLKNEDGREFIAGSYPLDTDDLNSYDRCLVKDCLGNLGLANIYYSILSVATTSNISIIWSKASGEAEIIKQITGPGPRGRKIKVEEPVLPLRYHGSIVAYYGRNFRYPTKKDGRNHWRVMLLNITKDGRVLENGEIPLSRSRVTVPVYSSLVIKVRLTALDSTSEERHKPRKYLLRGELVYDIGKRDDVKVLRKLDQSLCVTVGWHREEMPFIGVRRNEYFCAGGIIMEVSSVRVVINQNTDDKRDIEVYGTVRAKDDDELTLFSHEKDDSVHLFSDGDVLPLSGLQRCIEGDHFDVMLSLKEKTQDLEICHGYWDIYPGSEWRLYGTRLAAVFEGKDGYAVMHFTLYSTGVQAIMEAKLCVDTDAAIYGSLIARIENDEHAGEYVRKYFQTRLFDVSEADHVMLKPNCESGQPARRQILLPLMIGGVASNGYGHLIIEANLAYKTQLSNEWVKIESLVELKPQSSGESEFHIGEKDGGIDGRVGWFCSPRYARPLCKPYTAGEEPLLEKRITFKRTVIKNWT